MITFEDAADSLEHVLHRIDATIDDDARLEIREMLMDFIEGLPWEAEFTELRRIAQEADDDLSRAVNKSVLRRMGDRSKSLSRYVESLTAITEQTKKSIEVLRLNYVRTVTMSATDAIKAIHQIQVSIESNDLSSAAQKSEETVTALLSMIEEVNKEV